MGLRNLSKIKIMINFEDLNILDSKFSNFKDAEESLKIMKKKLGGK